MQKLVLALGAILMVVVTLTTPIARAEAPVADAKTSWTVDEVKELTNYYADEYGVSRKTMNTIISGESGYIYDLPGDHGTSWGACQIHLPDHTDITKEDAMNPDFCLDWTANQIKQGRARMWTQYRLCILDEKIYHEGKQLKCTAKV